MADTNKMTAAAHARLEADVAELEGPGRREVADRIGIAREWGDLKENAEYHAAKEDAAMLEARIARMREQLVLSEIVESVEAGAAAGMGSTVAYTDGASGRQARFKLVPSMDAKPAQGLLSIDSPVGQALAGSAAGDTVELTTPSGKRSVRIDAVEHTG
jgi:transcription elongation factor GreA